MASISKFVTSKGWKKLMSRMYGWGASLVIIGALFKLQHWTGAGIMLSIGMITECVIFFFSAFEPLPVEYHWETIYPELSGDNLNLEEEGATALVGSKNNARDRRLQNGVDLTVDPELAENLQKSVERFNQSINSLNALTTISEASQQFVSGLQQAATNMSTLNETAQSFADTYRETAQTVVDVYQNTSKSVNEHGQQANANLAVLNKNLQAVNTSYELYLQEHRDYVAHSKTLLGSMDYSAQQAQQFDQQMITLNKLIAELNVAYTSVVQTVNATLKRK
ncbi:MAG: gliding motility protein GldL [Prevotellaceae bacterium]|jgi:gliding motility-associated protein GldL|nr:gliding motility protein GldL [Prevotellaceae bacterium]